MELPASGPAADSGSSVWSMVAQMNVLSRLKTGSNALDLLVALLLPLLLTQLGALSKKLAQLAAATAAATCSMHERRITHTTTTAVSFWWLTTTGDDDEDDAESAPNSALHRALLHVINTAYADKALAWQSAEVKARRLLPAARGGAGGAAASSSSSSCKSQGSSVSGDADADDADSVDAGGEYKAYRYILLPPENKFIRLTPHVELKREVEVRESESNQAGRSNSTQQREQKTTFVLRARTARHVDAFLRAAVHSYNSKLRANRDRARYLYVPVLNGGAAGGAGAASGGVGGGGDGSAGGAASRAVTYRRYRLGDHRTFTSLFFPEKEEILSLVRAFTKKTGRFAMDGHPQKLGFLLHGPPGTGKTSLIRALAHLTGRHIVSIPLARVKTNADLMAIMHDERIKLQDDDETSFLPCSKVIFVLEDVDVASRVVRRRAALPAPASVAVTSATPVLEPSTPPPGDAAAAAAERAPSSAGAEPAPAAAAVEAVLLCEVMAAAAAKQSAATAAAASDIEVVASGEDGRGNDGPAAEASGGGGGGTAAVLKELLLGKGPARDDELNLAGLLNVLDGVVDTPGRIVVLTTNAPETLDPALVRPGRINRLLYLGCLRLREASEMVGYWFSLAVEAAESKVLAAGWVDGVMTPAELECMCTEHEEVERLVAALSAWFRRRASCGKATGAPTAAAAC